MKLNPEDLKDFLLEKAEFYNHPRFVETDPIQIPHQFSRKEDIEIIAFLVATIAWGNRKSIITNGNKLVQIMGESPHDYVLNYRESRHNFVHRTFNGEDLNSFFLALHRIYSEAGGLEECFTLLGQGIEQMDRIMKFRTEFTKLEFLDRSLKHIANPSKGSSAKRLNMYLRWMVRKDNKGVDFGIWNKVPCSDLRIPLDVHTGNVARKLGILNRSQDDWKSVEELHEFCVSISPNDPSKLDFALFGLGAFEGF